MKYVRRVNQHNLVNFGDRAKSSPDLCLNATVNVGLGVNHLSHVRLKECVTGPSLRLTGSSVKIQSDPSLIADRGSARRCGFTLSIAKS